MSKVKNKLLKKKLKKKKSKSTLSFAEMIRQRMITKRMKIKLATGEIVSAKIWGEKSGDVYGGEINYRGKKYLLGHPTKGLPKSAFPFKAVKPTPFVDLPHIKKKKQ